jgi:outer membrane protein assembly factor BamD (BamD/ComL family)
VKFDRITTAVMLVMIVCLSGCGVVGTTTVTSSTMIPSQERTFAGALEFLRSGNEQGAKELFERVVAAKPIKGITDEALFRLVLLHLRDESTRSVQRAHQLLDQLKSEYPHSIWTRQAAPLAAYLAGTRTTRDKQRELKTLRELNLSLSRDNRELRQTIERLKSLDLELEQKIQR